MAQYRDSKTKEIIPITTARSKYRQGEMKYFDQYDRELINPKTGNLLEPVPRDPNEPMPDIAIFTDTKSRFSKHTKEFKQRSVDHAKSPEQQALKARRTKQEMENYTGKEYKPKKKK